MNYDEFHGRVDITNITPRSLNVIYRVESHIIKPANWARAINEYYMIIFIPLYHYITCFKYKCSILFRFVQHKTK